MSCQVVLAERALINDAVAVSGHCDLPHTPEATPLARRFVRSHCDGLPAEVVETIELLTSELVTNVVLHARTHVHVGITRDAENVLVVVQDFSDQTSSQRTSLNAEELRETGRGMAIIASLADDFGWKRLTEEVGKIMWFAVSIRPSLDGASRSNEGLPLRQRQPNDSRQPAPRCLIETD